MFQVETRDVARASDWILQHRKSGTPLPGLIFDTTLTEYGDHKWRVSDLPGSVQLAINQTADIVIREPVRLIVIRGHSDFSWVTGGRNTHDEKRISALRAVDVWRNLSHNFSFRGFVPHPDDQVRLESIGALEPQGTSMGVNESNRRVEIFLFDKWEVVL